jgi:hypothetical protein
LSPQKASRPTSAGADRKPRGDLGGHQIDGIATPEHQNPQDRVSVRDICTDAEITKPSEAAVLTGSALGTPACWIVGRDRLKWRADADGFDLSYGTALLARVVPDLTWPGMYRVLWHGQVSDMTNLSRAKDAAVSIALGQLNLGPQETALRGSWVRQNAARVERS